MLWCNINHCNTIATSCNTRVTTNVTVVIFVIFRDQTWFDASLFRQLRRFSMIKKYDRNL